MDILILGFSNIVKRRVLPALLGIDSVARIDLASRHGVDKEQIPAGWEGSIYSDYDSALKDSKAQLVYISLINSLHEQWAESALLANKHVVVDKPALLSLAATQRLSAIANDRGVCLAEATVFNYHRQFDTIRGLLDESCCFSRVIAAFSFPPFPSGDFRNYPELGGGALLDLGPYAAATSRLFFSEAPNNITCHVNTRHSETNVETAFSILADYPGGGSYTGHFGFDTEYINRLTAFGPGISVTLDRAYTTPPELENRIEIMQANKPVSVDAPACDAFWVFFEYAISSIANHNWRDLTNAMLQDATFRERLLESTTQE
jgi:predicted dehydrogenase